MINQLTVHTDNLSVMVPASCSACQKSALTKFVSWLNKSGGIWYEPDLAAYRDKLLETVSPASAKVYLSTIRARYARILTDNSVRDILFGAIGERLSELGMPDTPMARKSMVDEIYTRLQNAVHPSNSRVKTTTIQDRADSETGLRLNREQVNTLRNAPDMDTLKGKRDRALISFLLATGIREFELAALTVDDLRQKYQGELALRVSHGKGDKQRLVVYGQNQWALALVDDYLNAAGITQGAVFRGLTKWGTARKSALTTRAIRMILASYPLDDGETTVHPHDCRRTYARAWFDAGGDMLALSQQLGHSSIKTTMKYIGLLDVSKRRAPTMYAI